MSLRFEYGRQKGGLVLSFKSYGFYLGVFGATFALWFIVATASHPLFFPDPVLVGRSFCRLIREGVLAHSILVSYFRILSGWAIGSLTGIPIGILIGRILIVRRFFEPYIQFFRFIPPIAFVTLALIWFGLGETSKVVLIVYTTTFIVILNTSAGVMSVEKEKIRAAQCLGAKPYQILVYVIVPAVIPYIVTGMRLAMGNSFMTVVAAEMIAAESGIGFLIYNSRLFMQTSNIFVGIIVLGLMGWVADLAFREVVKRLGYRYRVKF